VRRAASFALLAVLTCTGCATGLTGDPEQVSDHDARLAGQVVSNAGGEVEYWLEYGPTKSYGSQSGHQTIATVENAPKPVTVTIAGLSRSTSYHYRLCAQDTAQQGGPGCGEDHRLKTQSFACGETVTTDVRLTASMECHQADPGIAIGAPGVDINLAGHRLTSFFQVLDEFDPGARAVLNDGGYADLTVRNGSLSNWQIGVSVVGAARTQVLNLDTSYVNTGRYPTGGAAVLSESVDSEIRHVHALEGGIFIHRSTRAIVADSTTTREGGIRVYLSDDARIVRNSIEGAFSSGVYVYGNGNRIADNRVSGFQDGIRIAGGSGNVVAGNEVLEAIGDDTDSVGDFGFGDGIWVDVFTNGTVLQGNFVHDNRKDGIEVKASGTRLADNRAEGNRDWGIDAVAGVTDGGGNTASGNGEPAQCRNVFCQ
jgi:parallel beta-helix repeat protein